jgi:hypothetical protein
MQSLRQWRQALDALGAIEEGRRSGNDQVETGEAAGVDFVDDLPKSIRAFSEKVDSGRFPF